MKKRNEKLIAFYRHISKAKYDKDVAFNHYINKNAITDTASADYLRYHEKTSYYSGLIQALKLLGFDKDFIAWSKEIESELAF